MYSANPRAKRVEFRSPDPSCNGYLAFAAMLMAGLDGIQNRLDPGQPIDKNLYDLPPAEAKEVKSTPGTLISWGGILIFVDEDMIEPTTDFSGQIVIPHHFRPVQQQVIVIEDILALLGCRI